MESSFYKIVVGVSMTTEVLDEMACPIMYKIGYDRAGAFYKKIDNALLGNKKSFFSSLLLPLRAFNNLARLVHQGILCT